MSKVIRFECEACKESFAILPYFCNTDIHHVDDQLNGRVYYTARTVAKAVCPHCGVVNAQVCENEIYKNDIIDLAIRRYERG